MAWKQKSDAHRGKLGEVLQKRIDALQQTRAELDENVSISPLLLLCPATPQLHKSKWAPFDEMMHECTVLVHRGQGTPSMTEAFWPSKGKKLQQGE